MIIARQIQSLINSLKMQISESDPVTATVQSIPSISNAALKQLSHESPKTLASHVLEDIWQFKDCLLRLLPQSHSAFKMFRLAFREAIFVFDKNDQAQIKEFLGKKWDWALRRNPGEIYRRCWRYIPFPNILAPVLKTLFEWWRDVPCALDPPNQKLFSGAAWHDVWPPWNPTVFDMGVDKDGLHCYCTVGDKFCWRKCLDHFMLLLSSQMHFFAKQLW